MYGIRKLTLTSQIYPILCKFGLVLLKYDTAVCEWEKEGRPIAAYLVENKEKYRPTPS